MNRTSTPVRALLLLLILLFSKTSSSQTFRPPVPALNAFPGSGGSIGQFSKLLVVSGNPAMCYYDANRTALYYVRALDADGLFWGPAVTVDMVNMVGSYISFQIVNGNPAVAYYNFTSGDLKYARATDATGTTWATPVTVDATLDVGEHASLQVVNGNPAIAYYDKVTQALMYVRASDANGAAWGTPQMIDFGNVGEYASLQVVNGNPAIAYYNAADQDLMYIRATDADGVTWGLAQTVTGVGIAVGTFASLKVVNGNPAIAFYSLTDANVYYVRAVDANGVGWYMPLPVVTVSGTAYSSLEVVNGLPAITCFNAASFDLQYVHASDADGTTWDLPQTLDATGNVGQYPSMQIVNGNPAIAYYEQTGANLKYIRAADANGASWNAPQRYDAKGNVGAAVSAQIVNNHPAFSYYNVTNGDLEFVRAANAAGTSWAAPQTLAGAATDVGRFTSLQIVNGNPAIAYYDVTSQDLLYIRSSDNAGNNWNLPLMVDGPGESVGQFASMQTVNGNPAIAYYDATNTSLKFVRATDADGTAWDLPQTIDGAGAEITGMYVSLQIVNGSAAISYFDYTNGDLKFIRALDANGTTWGTPVTIDVTGTVGQYTSLQIVDGFPAISYYDEGLGTLKFVRATDASGTAWGTPLTIDASGDVGQYTSMQIVNGRPAITYLDAGNGDLKFVIADDVSGSTWATPVTVHSSESVGYYASMIAGGTGASMVYYHLTEQLPYFISTIDFVSVPVTLTKITAQWKNATVQLNWHVVEESDIDRYTIERSADGKTFFKIGAVAAVNELHGHDYSYIDQSPLQGASYYRLRIEENTGTKRYSTIVSLRPQGGETRQVSVYPNPVRNNSLQFTASLPAGEYKLKIVNSAGVQVMTRNYIHTGGTVVQVLPVLPQVTAGVYHLIISNSKLQVATTFVK